MVRNQLEAAGEHQDGWQMSFWKQFWMEIIALFVASAVYALILGTAAIFSLRDRITLLESKSPACTCGMTVARPVKMTPPDAQEQRWQ